MAKGTSLGPQGKPYIDTMKLMSPSLNDIGVYKVKINIGQYANDPKQGINPPYQCTLPTASYNFVVTVNPCII